MLSARASAADYRKAAITLLLGLVLLGAFMIVLGGNWFWVKRDMYTIRFGSIKDLTRGRVVKYAGLDVGRVESISLDDDPHYILVRIGLNKGFPIYEGTVARIAQKGLVGDYYVLLELQGEPGQRLRPGAEIQAVSTMDMHELAAKAGRLLDEVTPKIDEIAGNIAQLLTKENTAALRRALEKTPEMVNSLQLAADDFRRNWETLATKGSKAADRLETTLARVEKAVGPLEQAMLKTLANMQAQSDKVGGLAVDLRTNFNYDQEQLETILTNLNRTSRTARELLDRLRERPWEIIRPPAGTRQ